MLTTCGSKDPAGVKARAGADGAVDPAAVGEYVAPTDYPTDEALAEMVDPYEALICWFYVPPCDVGGVEKGGAAGVACFVAYNDEGKRRGGAVGNSGDLDTNQGGNEKNPRRLAQLERKRAAIKARARGGRLGEGGEGFRESRSSSEDGLSEIGEGVAEDELDANEFEPGALRVRVIMAGPGTTEQLRKATGAFLSAARNPNPVSETYLYRMSRSLSLTSKRD